MLTHFLRAVPKGPPPILNQVALLLHGDGTNGAQNNTFIDSSSNNFTVTKTGNTAQGSFSPFPLTAAYSTSVNGGSAFFDASGDSLDIAANTAFAMGTGDFTLECFFNMRVLPASNTNYQLIDLRGLGTFSNNAPALSIRNTSGTYSIRVETAGTVIADRTFTATINTWYHVAFVRSGGVGQIYLNGVSLGASFTYNTNFTTGFAVRIGNYTGATSTMNGWLSQIRIVKGTAVYTGSSYTVPTAPLTNITNTSLLLSCINAGIIDNAAQNNCETVGNAQISTSVTKFGTGSMAFDGTGDWLIIGDKLTLRLDSNPFTIEAWVYLSATGAVRGIVGKGQATSGWLLSTNASNQVVFTFSSSTITSTGTLAGSTWHHIAVVREGTGTNQTKIYINGTNDGTGTVATVFNQTTVMLVGADRSAANPLNGYIDDLRITNGSALYTANFTPPTAAFPDV